MEGGKNLHLVVEQSRERVALFEGICFQSKVPRRSVALTPAKVFGKYLKISKD